MGNQPQLFKIDPSKKDTQAVKEIEFAEAGFKERDDIQEWIVANRSILDEDLLVIAKEFSGFDRTAERADIVAVDAQGNVVVIELKRDDTGASVHWQAIKYASYFQRARPEDIVGMLAAHAKISEEEAVTRLKQHLDVDDLESLNGDQRIILASHRFAPEVTSAVQWLNDKALIDGLITCVQLTPYRDNDSNSFYIQASTILPVPGVEEVTLGTRSRRSGPGRMDEVTRFFRGTASIAINALSGELRPDRKSLWAGVGPINRYYQLWYSSPPWGNHSMRYQLLLPKETQAAPFEVTVRFRCDKKDQVKRYNESDSEGWFSGEDLVTLRHELEGRGNVNHDDRWLLLDESLTGDSLDSSFQDSVGEMVRHFIDSVTQVVSRIPEEENEERDKTE